MATAARGVVSRITARASGSSASEVTRWPVTISPPSERTSAAKGVGDGRGTAADHRPADGVGVHAEDEPEAGTQRSIERQHRVRRQAGEQRPGRLAAESRTGESSSRADRGQAEPGHGQRVARHVDHRPEQLRRQAIRVAHQRREQPTPRPAVAVAEAVRRGRHGPFQQHGPVGRQRVRDGSIGVDQLHAMGSPVDGPHERRRQRQRQDRRAHVVVESGERQLLGPGPATDGRGGLVDADRAPGTEQGDRRGQAVRAGADDDGIDPGGHGVVTIR